MKQKAIRLLTILFSVLYIAVGNRIATRDLAAFEGVNDMVFDKVKAVSILERTPVEYPQQGLMYASGFNVRFLARFLTGENKGETVEVTQFYDPFMAMQMKEVEKGDKLLIARNPDPANGPEWYIGEYVRSDGLLLLGLVFAACLILFGRRKGVSTIISLVFTCLAIFTVFVPAILSGQNIYFWSVSVAAFIVAMTLLLVNGPNRKSLAAGFGCMGGVSVAGLLTLLMDKALHLTGLVDEDSVYLLFLNAENPIDMNAIIFSAIIIGAIGAILDVSVDIAASLQEISLSIEEPTFKRLVQSGLTIGRDLIGTMSNTLILAYIGSSLSVVLLMAAYNHSILFLLNREMIVVEILQALAGSFGVLFALPVTSVICGILYTHADLPALKRPDPDTSAPAPVKEADQHLQPSAGAVPEEQPDSLHKYERLRDKFADKE